MDRRTFWKNFQKQGFGAPQEKDPFFSDFEYFAKIAHFAGLYYWTRYIFGPPRGIDRKKWWEMIFHLVLTFSNWAPGEAVWLKSALNISALKCLFLSCVMKLSLTWNYYYYLTHPEKSICSAHRIYLQMRGNGSKKWQKLNSAKEGRTTPSCISGSG